MMKNSKFGSRGLTLIEIVLAIGIFAVLGMGVAALSYLYAIYNDRLPQEQLRAATLRLHQTALEDLKRNIREAGEILATTTIDSQLYTTGTTTLVLRRRAIDANGYLLTNQYDRLVYTLSGTNAPFSLRKLLEPSASSSAQRLDNILSNAVKEFALSYNHSDPPRATAVSIYLVTEKTDRGYTYQATSRVEATLH
jgi:type II secretory pathway pseudopilin PulG